MTNRSVTFVIIALAVAIASGPVIAQETKPKPPATPTAKPKPPAPQGAKPKPPATTAKPGTGQKPAAAAPGAGPSAAVKARLRTPAKLKDVAPATFRARFVTSVGPFVVEVHRDWAPIGADRFYNLVKYGFFDGVRFFRVVRNFMVQFGINGDPSVQSAWREANLKDDPVKQSNKRGYVTFAMTSAPNTRSTQVFINFKDNCISGQDRVRAVRRSRPGHGGRRQAQPGVRRSAESGAGTNSDAGQRVSQQGVSEARLRHEGDD